MSIGQLCFFIAGLHYDPELPIRQKNPDKFFSTCKLCDISIKRTLGKFHSISTPNPLITGRDYIYFYY